jgi:hypothetical protein
MINLPIYQKGRAVAQAMVDDQDIHLTSSRWHQHQGYPCRSLWIDGRTVHERLHWIIAGCRGVDHRDRNRLNAQRSNLRPATAAQNLQNLGSRTDRPRGVYPTRGGRWRAMAKTQGKQHYVGTFDSIEEAGRAVSIWRAEHFDYALEVTG